MIRRLFITIPIYTMVAIVLISQAIFARQLVWQWQNPTYQGNHLYALWCISGNHFIAAGALGTFIEFDGNQWQEHHIETIQNLRDIWGKGNDRVAVGDMGQIFHFNGNQWQTFNISKQPLNALWANSSTDMYAFGNAGTIFHFSNNAWKSIHSPTAANLKDAIGFSKDIFVVGTAGTLIHYDTKEWHVIDTPQSADFTGIWGTNSNNIYVCGTYFNDNWQHKSCVYFFDGINWTELGEFETNVLINHIWGDTHNRIYAISDKGRVFLFEDSIWKQVFESNHGLHRLHHTSEGFIAVGENGQFIRENDSIWSDTYNNPDHSINAIWSDSAHTFAVCQGGIILSRQNNAWDYHSQPSLNNLNDISGNDQHIFVVGKSGFVAVYNGQAFEKIQTPTYSDISAITVMSDQAIAVGEQGLVMHYTHQKWEIKESTTSQDLFDIWSWAHDCVFAVGKHGTIIFFDGITWKTMNSPTSERLYAVWGIDPNHVFATGKYGTMLHFDGQQWQLVDNFPTSDHFNAMWGNHTHIYAVGNNGTICRYDGADWQLTSSPCTADLQSVWGHSETDIYIAGDNGVILHYPYQVQKTLSLLLPTEVSEDQGSQNVVIQVTPAPDTPLQVQIQSSLPQHVRVSESITIPSGYTKVLFQLTVIDNQIHDGEKHVNIEAKADNFTPAVASLTVADNESDRGIWVVNHEPRGLITNPVDYVKIQFNREVDTHSFDIDDIIISGPFGPITVKSDMIWIANDIVQVTIASQEATGCYTILVGPDISGHDNRGMDQDGDDQFFEPIDDVYTGRFELKDQSGPYVIARSPGERVKGPIVYLTVEFNEAIAETSIGNDDFVISAENGTIAAIDRIVRQTENRYEIYPTRQIVSGKYQLFVGPNITDIAGNLMNQDRDNLKGESFDDRFACRFAIDHQGPRILFHSLFGRQNQAISSFDLTFNEPVLESTFTMDTIAFTGPDGAIPIQQIDKISIDVYRIFIPPQHYDGFFKITLQPVIEDIAGNFLDQNQNGIGGEDDDLFELTILQELPDLVVSEIECPPEALPGANIEIKWSVQNTGTGNTTHEWQDHIYLSDDNMVGDDQFVSSVDNQVVLASKEHYFRSISIPVPDKNETHHWIIIKTNANNTQDENNFTNNQSIITYPFWNTRRAYPDLYVGDIFTPNTIYVGELSTLAWQVINQGNGPTSAILWMDRVFLSQDTVLDNQDIEIATIRNPDFLASGETYHQELEMVLSSDIPENDYYVFVAADTKDQVEEFDQESNNIKMAASPVSVHVPTPGVLMVTSFIAPNQAAPGDSIQLTWTVKNIGQTTIASTNHMILLSKNIQLEPDLDVILLWTSAENYRPGQSYTLNHTVNMPSLIDMGAYYLIPATNQSMTLEKPFVSPITVTTSVFPDLVVTESMDFPERLKTDQLLTISWQVGNTGAGNTLISNWLDYLYLSKDRKADDSDIYLGKSRHDEILFANNGHTRVTKTFKLPEQLNGIYYVGIQTDALQTVNESDETNNYTFSQSSIHIQRLQTDLIVLSVHAPYSAITGQEASIEWLVQNNGVDTTASSFWVDQVYVSTDQTLDDKDILMGEITHTMTLDPGQTVKKSLTETIPSLMDGHYYVIVQVDAQNAIFESDGEQNNTYVSSEPTHVHHLFPDIQILGIKADNSEVYANESIALSYTLVNNGQTGTYGTWLDRFYLSEDNLLDLENDMIIGEITHETQIPQGTKICIHSDRLTMPARLSGAYTIFVQVDALNQLYEYGGENNNHGPCAVNIQDSPSDLQIISVNAPDSAYAGTAIHVSWEVQNKGRQDTQEAFWYDRVYLSSDNNLSPEYDIQVGNIIHKQPLKAGETYTCSHYFVIRQDLGGPYHIFVQTDAENQVYENLQENNNITQSQTDILLTGLYVDLYPSDLQFKSQQPFAGQPLDVSWQVENKGYDPTHVSSWEDIIYLSTDGIPDINDTILGVYQHNGVLNAGEFYIKTKTITIPKDIDGKYYLIVKTDANAFNDVFEDQGEDNNSICKEIHVETSPTPNLTVTELIVPNQAWSGQYLRVEWSVENNGAIDIQTETGFWYDSVYLSRDPFLDVVHDIPIGNVMYKGVLPKISGIYKQFLDTMLPPGISGPYYVIVQTDSSIPQHVYETNRMDNVRIADNIIDIQLTPPSDLIVTSISIPETGKPGELLTWQFDIKNNGDRPAVGSWYDTLYLSADKVWDTQDYRIARFYQDGDIPDKKEYTAVVPAIVPTAIPGAYYVIVRTDILDDIRETNESNNMRVSSQTIQIENTIIERNEIIKDTISSGDFKYFQLNTKQSEDIEVFLNGPAALCSQFFVGEGFIPGRSQYDHRSTLIEDQRLMLNLSELSSDNYFLSLYGHRCEKDTPFEISVNYLVSLRIHELSVSKATNIGMTTLQIKGAHFDDNIHVRLMLNDIELDRVQSVNILNSGQISLTLDLHDLQKGKYHIVLENPDQETAQTTFEVVSDKRGELFARLLIPGYVTQNKVFRFTLEYGNIGHSDILAPLLLISAGDGGLLRKDSSDDFSDEPIQILGLSDRYPVDVLPPDSFFTVKFEFMLTTDEYVPFYIQVMDQPEAPIDWEGLQTRLRPQKIDDQMWKIIFTKFKTDMGQTWGDYVNRLRKNAVDSADYGTAIRDVYTLLPNLTNGRTNIKMALPIPPGTRRTSGGSLAPETDDGQDKLTSIGAGTLHHMLFDRTIEYTIRFENKSHASASAQYIQISDPLSEKLAIDTFELKEISLGDYQIDIPQYHSYYHTRLDLRPSGQDLIVDIEAGIDDATRMARWIFTAIDPATGEQSEDPLTGFLPPNASGHSGEGYVRFQIKPLANIESGTIISNMATIIFDRNEPVDTPIAYNTVDLNLPESRVERMASPEQLEIPVRWGGQDTMDGSGIASYDVYVSENDQPYEIWLSKTTATSGIYVGKPGHQYSFYSIATDRVGNIEAPPAQPDAVVKLKNTSPPNRPILISPDSNALNIGSSPILKTGAFTDLDGSTHLATRWQISKTLDFELLVMDIQSQIFLTELIVPNGILSENTIYYWQAKHIDEHESASHWSQYRQFATTTFDVPVISNTDLNLDQNEMLDIHQTDIAIVEVDTIYIGVKSETSGVTVVSANAFDYTADFGLPPAEMPYGLISFRAECPKGSEVDIQLYFSENLPSNAKWYKFDFHNGFSDYSAHTQSNLPGHQITITVKDGGYGDADGLENGVIVDPGGIGIFSENVLLDNDDSSGSCFLELIQF